MYVFLEERFQGIRAVRGRGVLHYRSRGKRHRSSVVIAARGPLDFRVEGLSEFGSSEYQIASLGGEVTIYWPRENRYQLGMGGGEDFARLFSVPLTAEEIVRLLLSTPFLEPEDDYRFLQGEEDLFSLKGHRNEMIVLGKGEDWLPIQAFDLTDAEDTQVVYDDYRFDQSWFPYRVRATFGRSTLDLQWEEIEINGTVSSDLFRLEIPEDAVRVYD